MPLIIHDGELADICRMLAELGLAFVEAPALVPDVSAYYSAPLVIAGPQFLLDQVEDNEDKHPTRVVILTSEARTLRSILARSGVAWVVRRPVHPTALRLFILHCLYRGYDKRQNERVSIGCDVTVRRRWSRRAVLLAEISQRDCRFVTQHAFKIDQKLTLQLPRKVTHQRPLSLTGRVVRVGSAECREGRDVCLMFEHLGSRGARVLADVIEMHAAGPAIFAGALPPTECGETPAPTSSAPALDDHRALDSTHAQASSDEDVSPENRRATPRHSFGRRVIALGDEAARVLLGRDISLYGMRVDASPSISLGDELQIALHAPGLKTPLVVRAEVQRDDGERGQLLHFVDVSPEAVECLAQILQPLPELSESPGTSETLGALETLDGDGEEPLQLIVSEILEHRGERPASRYSSGKRPPERIRVSPPETERPPPDGERSG